jgi:hypothetical protein
MASTPIGQLSRTATAPVTRRASVALPGRWGLIGAFGMACATICAAHEAGRSQRHEYLLINSCLYNFPASLRGNRGSKNSERGHL